MSESKDYYQPCVCRDCVCPDCGTRFKKSTKWKLSSGNKIYKGKVYLIRKCTGCANNESIMVAWCE